MLLSELFSANEQSVDDAVMFHTQLNPNIWQDNKMKPMVRYKLMLIALEFADYIGIQNLGLTDVIMTGSNASYNYTNYSDIDLHLVVKMPEDNQAIKELFDAKKGLWNEQHAIKIKGFDVELYVQDADEPHISSGMYSILNDDWIKEPKPIRPEIDDVSVEKKYHQYHDAIQQAAKDNDFAKLQKIKSDIKKMRQSGLDKAGEFSAENLAFKLLRNLGDMEILMNTLARLKDQQLGLKELHKT